ncbi:hypothetical protein EC973_008172 [Apophysomyces ossiformis]|uniref:eRF1/Pelota-like N-terminal domain-containing protein n=1 Tax=Apophysomyces ossiformis TaxID=679940 RepID=A0A8H7EPB1_9FUNG|nr:hypothetical protein EC973_008172 [Apophysomyces ossiformis]
MRASLISKAIEKDKTGYVTLYPEELEDMWHVYNLISKEDKIKATTIRRLQSESSTGSSTSQRIRLVLTITVESVDFDPHVGLLRINGRVASESQHVKAKLNRNFTLYKPEWDTIALERVDDACDITKQADLAAIVCQEERFYEQIYQAILRHIHFDIVKAIIIASPGFVKDKLYEYIFYQAVKTDNKVLMENKSKFVLIHCSSGHKHSLNEVMQDPSIQNKLADTKAAREVQALEKFYEMLNNDPDRAFYGFNHVSKANERGAIATLLVTDELFRSADIATRRKYVELVEQVRAMNGTVFVFSSLHVSGEQLNQLSGVAATLNFPLPDIELEEEEEEE